MSKDEIIDKVKSIACYGDEFHTVACNIERLKAIAACTQSYCDNIPNGGKVRIYITDMLELIEELVVEIDSDLSKATQTIINVTAMSE